MTTVPEQLLEMASTIARHPKGVPVDVPAYLEDKGNPEAAEKWREEHEKHKDNFKNSSDATEVMESMIDKALELSKDRGILPHKEWQEALDEAFTLIRTGPFRSRKQLSDTHTREIEDIEKDMEERFKQMKLDKSRRAGVLMAAESGGKAEYNTYFKKKMKEHGLEGISGVDDAKLKKFFTDVDKGWKADKESSIPSRLASLAEQMRTASKE